VIGLVSVLLALAGLLAERAIALARGGRLGRRIGVVPEERGLREIPWVAVWIAGGLASALVVGPLVAGVATAVGLVVRHVFRRRRAARVRGLVADQLADAVSATAAGLRSGLSLPQSLAYARDEVDEPLRSDLTDLVGAIDVGVPIGEALDAWAEMHGTEDARLLAGVLDLHRRSGGDLPSVLDGLAVTLRERRNAQREVRALTAQARLSGVILGLLPIGFFAFLMLTSRHEMLEAIATPLGGSALGIGLGLEVLAFLWIRHLLEVR
jgi:tight adherence protein B